MIPGIAIEIIDLSLSILKDARDRDIQHDPIVGETLVEIAQRTAQAYLKHTGEPMDPSIIRFEKPID